MKKIILVALTIAVAASAILFSSCKKDDKNDPTPAPGAGVMGDWVTATGVDYVNIVFTSQYTYIIKTVDKTETGDYVVNIKKGEISLLPNLDGAKERVLKYTRTSDQLTITSGSLFVDGTPSYVKFPLVLSVQ